MLYADYQYFTELYGSDVPEQIFNRLIWAASKILDHMTTGVDGYKKLENAYPVNPDDSEAIKRCVCELVQFAYEIEESKKALGYVTNVDGTVNSRMVSSRSSGAESISYAAGGNAVGKTAAASAAVGDDDLRRNMQVAIVRQYLDGVKDANGVNILYLGGYPRCALTARLCGTRPSYTALISTLTEQL